MAARGSTTLGEVMGAEGAERSKGLTLDDLPNLLGEGMPELQFHALGRVKLLRALRNRFGDNYKSVPGISGVLQQFDKEAEVELAHHKIKQKWGRKK